MFKYFEVKPVASKGGNKTKLHVKLPTTCFKGGNNTKLHEKLPITCVCLSEYGPRPHKYEDVNCHFHITEIMKIVSYRSMHLIKQRVYPNLCRI